MILITGNGSSFPAANFLAKFLTLQKSKKAMFCPTSELLVFEIESYGHGWYTTDQNDEKTLYLLVSHKNYAQSLFAKSRIESLVKNGNCDFLEITTDLDEIYGNIWTLIWTSYLVDLFPNSV